MPSAVSSTQIQQLINTVNAGNYTAAYDYLSSQGYSYADWANGVAQGNSIAGVSALEFLESTAMMGLDGSVGQTLSSEAIESIRQGMAREYLNVLAQQAQDNGGIASEDINARDVWEIHDKVFTENNLSIENWTLNAPFQIYQNLYGDQVLEDFWTGLRDTGGTGADAMLVNSTVLWKMFEFSQSTDPAVRALAESWMEFVPGIVSLEQFSTLMDVLSDFITTTALNLEDFLLYLGGSLLDFIFPPAYGADINPLTNSDFTAARNWFQRRDPLTLDLDSDGLETVGINPANPILFDHDGDGVANATGWIKPDDGFLVLDRNGNGLIDNGTELFGDSTPLVAGGTAADGFAALAQEDTNGDGLVNAGDANWNELRVWQDANSDGITDAGELHSLESLGITGFHVAKSENTTRLSNGNQIADLGSFIRDDGSEGTVGQITGGMADIDLADNPFYRSFSDTVPPTEQAQALPDMQGSGMVRDLREAVSQSPALGSALTDYAAADTKAAQMALIDGLISQWAASSGFQTSIEKAAAQNDQLLFLVPGLKAYDVLGGSFASSGGSSSGSTGLTIPTAAEIAQLEALKAQQIHITQILGMLEKFNGMTFVNIEPDSVRTGANRFAEDGGQYPKQAANDAVFEMKRVG